MPDEKNIRVQAAADSLILTGDVSDGAAVARANDLAAGLRAPRRSARWLQKSDDKDAPSGAGRQPAPAVRACAWSTCCRSARRSR